MKKLICADDIKAVAQQGQKIFYVAGNAIITPAAKDLAQELGVEVRAELPTAENQSCKGSGLQQKDNQGKGIDRDIIYQVIKMVLGNKLRGDMPATSLAKPFHTDCEAKSGLKIVRGRTVTFEKFDTGDGPTNVAYREVISKDDSNMSAGFLTIEKSSFDWELCYEEINIILEGSLSITINGETYEACQGDVLFVPKGSKVTWSSTGYVKLFYATYPANWPDLVAKQ